MTTILRNSDLTAIINHRGAELISLKDVSGKNYIWNGNPEFWAKHSPVLFPIVGTLKDNSYLFNNITYNLQRHGFARDMLFDLTESTSDTATFSLLYSEDTLAKYPFKFELLISYMLADSAVTVKYNVINLNDFQMPFSIGGHPAFALPENFDDYTLEFEIDEKLQYHLLENNLISDKTNILKTHDRRVALRYDLFKDDALIFKQIQSESITVLHKLKPRIKVDFADFPHLGIWTLRNAPFLCIEPWFGYSDTNEATGNLLEKEGIRTLQPAENFISKFTIEIF